MHCAFRAIDAVARFALSLTRDRSDADDLVQDTYLRAFRGWRTFRPGSDARRWLFAICRNAFLRTRRRRGVFESDRLRQFTHLAHRLEQVVHLRPENVADQHLDSASPAIQRFVGASGDMGKMLGLDNRWAYNIVKRVGNYGESFERNLTPLGFDRGINKLWTQGGLMYAPPIR